MFKWLKNYLIPHDKNNFTPLIFREAEMTFLFLVIIGLFTLAISGNVVVIRSNLTALVLPKVLVDYANEDRNAENYSHLAVSSVLEKAAQMKADDMAKKGYFAHKSPDGHTPWYFFEQAGYKFSYAGENLAVNFVDSVDVNKAWMNSPGHRANIMNGNFTEIGIATAEGMYEGKRTVFVVQLFGTPVLRVSNSVTKPVSSGATTTKIANNKTAIAEKSTSSPTVLSESVSTNNTGSEMFVSVANSNVKSESVKVPKQSSFFERIIMSPKKVLSVIYLFIIGIILFALASLVFVEFRKHHLRSVYLSIGIIIIILGLLYIYQNILFYPLEII